MASNPTTEQGEAEEEEEQEGKATDTTVNATESLPSQAGSDSAAQKGTPTPSQHSPARSPVKPSPAPTEIIPGNESQEASKNVSTRTVSISDGKSSGKGFNLSGSRQLARSVSESVRASMMRKSGSASGGVDSPTKTSSEATTKASSGVTTGLLQSNISAAQSLHQSNVSAPQSLPRSDVSAPQSLPRSNVSGAQSLHQSDVSGAQSLHQSDVSGAQSLPRSNVSGAQSLHQSDVSAAQSLPQSDVSAAQSLPQSDVSAPQSLPQTSPVERMSEASSKHASARENLSENEAERLTESGVVVAKPALGASRPPKKGLKGPGQTDVARAPQAPSCFGSSRLFERRSPFVHNPPYPEERRARILQPQCPRDYIINLREDLADFQESHGLPRTRDYSFLSLGLSLAQETGRAIYAVFLMITELVPVIAIVSLILRFALDKLIEILETDGTVPRAKKSAIFVLQILIIMIPLWILVGTIIIPLFYLVLSIFWKLFRLSGHKKGKQKTATPASHHPHPTPVRVKK